jgi:hypothetical protein
MAEFPKNCHFIPVIIIPSKVFINFDLSNMIPAICSAVKKLRTKIAISEYFCLIVWNCSLLFLISVSSNSLTSAQVQYIRSFDWEYTYFYVIWLQRCILAQCKDVISRFFWLQWYLSCSRVLGRKIFRLKTACGNKSQRKVGNRWSGKTAAIWKFVNGQSVRTGHKLAKIFVTLVWHKLSPIQLQCNCKLTV